MTKAFIKRVKREKVVDTRNYRYIGGEVPGGDYEISRLPIDYLDRPAALDKSNWKVVYREEH